MLLLNEIDTLTMTVTDAVDLAAEGEVAVGYACLEIVSGQPLCSLQSATDAACPLSLRRAIMSGRLLMAKRTNRVAWGLVER
jgi:hypothetical protein